MVLNVPHATLAHIKLPLVTVTAFFAMKTRFRKMNPKHRKTLANRVQTTPLLTVVLVLKQTAHVNPDTLEKMVKTARLVRQAHTRNPQGRVHAPRVHLQLILRPPLLIRHLHAKIAPVIVILQ
jgi:hypothetical protein